MGIHRARGADELDRGGEVMATLRATIEAIRDDIAEALDTRVTPKGYCATCETDHANEARLNRAVLSGLLRRLAAALAQPDAGEGETTQALRERFEKWATAWGLSVAMSDDGATVGYDDQETGMAWLAVLEFAKPSDNPIPMVLHCPKCGTQHIDAPNPERGWDNPPHRSHECQGCGAIWRPSDVATAGVLAVETRGKADTWKPADTPLADPPNLRLFTADGLFYLYGMGASGSGPTTQAAMRDWTRARNTHEAETWCVEPADTPPPRIPEVDAQMRELLIAEGYVYYDDSDGVAPGWRKETPPSTQPSREEVIARTAHAGQKDTVTGADYITHVERVVARVSDAAKPVAWLHDVIEDTAITVEGLIAAGVPAHVVEAVLLLTRICGPYERYIAEVCASGNKLAIEVKLADLEDHLTPTCPERLRPRYEAALPLVRRAHAEPETGR